MVNKFLKNNMGLIGSLGQLLFYVQAFSIFYDKKSGNISLLGFLISLISSLCWLYYGGLKRDKPLMISSTIGLCGALLVIMGIIIYH